MEYKLQKLHFQHSNLPEMRQDSLYKFKSQYDRWKIALVVCIIVVIIIVSVTIHLYSNRTEENITFQPYQITETSIILSKKDTSVKPIDLETSTSKSTCLHTNLRQFDSHKETTANVSKISTKYPLHDLNTFVFLYPSTSKDSGGEPAQPPMISKTPLVLTNVNSHNREKSGTLPYVFTRYQKR